MISLQAASLWSTKVALAGLPGMLLNGLLWDDDEDYENCFNTIYDLSHEFAKQYLLLIWMDSVCYNMDRHTENFGFIRDIDTGEIISLAPNYDNNIALIAKGYPTDKTRQNDGLIRFLREFIQSCDTAHEMYREMDLPEITEEIMNKEEKEITLINPYINF